MFSKKKFTKLNVIKNKIKNIKGRSVARCPKPSFVMELKISYNTGSRITWDERQNKNYSVQAPSLEGSELSLAKKKDTESKCTRF